MAFDDILAQDTAVQTLRRALASGRVHHAYRFEGPDGVGKEMAAFALAEALVCGADDSPQCTACRRRVRTVSEHAPHVPLHPDIILVQRGLYAEQLGKSEANGIGIEQIRRIVLARAPYSPHEGLAQVFILRDADEITVQAANALLKTLEEPPPQTHFVLLTSRPRRMLDTVLSRTLPIRFAPLPDEVIARILTQRGLPTSVVPLARGSASRALALADEDALQRHDEFVARALECLDAPSLAGAIGLLDTKTNDRRAVRDQLEYLAHAFAAQSRAAVNQDPQTAERAARRHGTVLSTMQRLERNVQPALALEAMMVRLRRQ
jgi:DNA polymerase-3 subunit delta'